MVLLIIIPFLNGYFIGNINPTFSDKPRWQENIRFNETLTPVTSQFFKKYKSGLSSDNIQQLLEDHPSRSQGAPSCKFVAFCSPILL